MRLIRPGALRRGFGALPCLVRFGPCHAEAKIDELRDELRRAFERPGAAELEAPSALGCGGRGPASSHFGSRLLATHASGGLTALEHPLVGGREGLEPYPKSPLQAHVRREPQARRGLHLGAAKGKGRPPLGVEAQGAKLARLERELRELRAAAASHREERPARL